MRSFTEHKITRRQNWTWKSIANGNLLNKRTTQRRRNLSKNGTP